MLFLLAERKAMAQAAIAQETQPKQPRTSGWTPERRARQAARIKIWAPWAKSTGPKTAAGKARAAQNAYKHGGRAAPMCMMRKALSFHGRFLRGVKAYARIRKFLTNELLEQEMLRRLIIDGFAASTLLNNAAINLALCKNPCFSGIVPAND